MALSSKPFILLLYFSLPYIFVQHLERNFFQLLFQDRYFCLNSGHFPLSHLRMQEVVSAPKSPFKLHLNLSF